MNLKECGICFIHKPLTLFSKDKSRKDGHYCKDCINERRDKTKAAEISKKWYEKNKAQHASVRREYVRANKERVNKYSREWRKKNRARCSETFQNSNLKALYGITLEQKREMLKEQKEVCAICMRPEVVRAPLSLKPRSLSVDHDHLTNKVRGLLCSRCNQAVGLLRDNPEFFLNGYSYLRKYAT